MVDVCFENADFLVIHKTPGVNVERSPYGYPSTEEEVAQYLGGKTSKFVGVVHRLDRPVSGLLLMAKKPGVLRTLNNLFAEKKVFKEYTALTQSPPSDSFGVLQHWLTRTEDRKRAVASSEPIEGYQQACLEYKTGSFRDTLTEWTIHPMQGRYHQIRIQLATAGCPILGDEIYGGERWPHTNQIALCATRLRFTWQNQEMEFTSPAPWQASNFLLHL